MNNEPPPELRSWYDILAAKTPLPKRELAFRPASRDAGWWVGPVMTAFVLTTLLSLSSLRDGSAGMMWLASPPALICLYWVQRWCQQSGNRAAFSCLAFVLNASLAAFVAGGVNFIVRNLAKLSLLQFAVFLAPCVEEVAKFGVTGLILLSTIETPLEAICCAASTGLGFAAIENAQYFTKELHNLHATRAAFWCVVALRSITVMGHALHASFAAVALPRLKTAGKNYSTYLWIAAGLTAGIVFHALHNFILISAVRLREPLLVFFGVPPLFAVEAACIVQLAAYASGRPLAQADAIEEDA